MAAPSVSNARNGRERRPGNEAPSALVRNWRTSPRETLHQAERYSAFVRVMKRALPLAALGLAIAVLIYALQPREVGRMAMTFDTAQTIENDLTMIRPRLTGVDDDGRPFVVTAETAVQEQGAERIRLDDVRAELTLANGSPLLFTAAEGVLDRATSQLDIYGGIEVSAPDGYIARTATARADLRTGLVLGNSPVTAEGKMGTLRAERFSFDKNTQQLLFLGDVNMLINGATQ